MHAGNGKRRALECENVHTGGVWYGPWKVYTLRKVPELVSM